MEKVKLSPERKSVLLMSNGRKAYFYAKSGRFPHEDEPLMREQRGMCGFFRGRVGYNAAVRKRVALLEERITAVHVFWKMGGEDIWVAAPGQWEIWCDSSDKHITGILGSPSDQVKLHNRGWKYIREVSQTDWNYLESLT